MASLLGRLTVQPKTRQLYLEHFTTFRRWARHHGLNLSGAHATDRALTHFIHRCYRRATYSAAALAFSAVLHFFPHYRGRLGISAQALRGWKKQQPSVPRPALPGEIIFLIAAMLTRRCGFEFGLVTLLAFDCYLRPSEVFALCADCVVLPSVSVGAALHQVAVIVKKGKTDRNAALVIQREPIARLLVDFFSRRHGQFDGHRLSGSCPSPRLFSISMPAYRAAFRRACDRLHLPPSVVLHSLRASGATEDFLRSGDFVRVRERGRWKSDQVCRGYLQAATAFMHAARIRQRWLQLGLDVSNQLYQCLSPSLPQS